LNASKEENPGLELETRTHRFLFMSSLSPSIVTTTNSWAVRMAESVLHNYPPSAWKWHYEHGLFMKAVLDLGLATAESGYQQLVGKWLDHFISTDGKIHSYDKKDYSLDQINPGRLLFHYYSETKSICYRQAIELLHDQVYRQPRTASGGLWHKKIYPQQMWLDGLYMAEPFRVMYATTFDELAILDDVIHQFVLMEEHARDEQTGLLYHGWDESRKQKWANPETGCSPSFWGRGMGWFAMAAIDVLDYLPESYPRRSNLVDILRRLSAALLHYQDPTTGLWWQVINRERSTGNYLEASVSAMLVYVFCKAVRRGFLEKDYLSAAGRAYRGLLEKKIKVDGQGRLTLEGTCGMAGLGGVPYRNGTFEYYISERTSPNDFKGVGPFILATLEMEKSRTEKTS
jgi:unsaturated rhamnogalacturonyl hydrolase